MPCLPAPHVSGAVGAEAVHAFAIASLDTNPVHYSGEAAREAGFDGPVLHGMFIAAMFETYLDQMQQHRLTELKVRFVTPAPVGTALMLSARLLGQTGAQLHLRLIARSQAGKILGVAEARLRHLSEPPAGERHCSEAGSRDQP